jgi:hypothetical protein
MKYIIMFYLSFSVLQARADSHAPIGVMGDHIHNSGEWMFSYRAMLMQMDGTGDGTTDIAAADVLSQGYMVAPTKMSMTMHMLGVMFAPTNNLTLTAMTGYIQNNMDMQISGMMSMDNPMISGGISDTSVGALYRILHGSNWYLLTNLHLRLPTGSISETMSMTMMGNAMTMTQPYPMQPGSGSFQLQPALTFIHFWNKYSVGSQVYSRIPLAKNASAWQTGNIYASSIWLAWLPVAEISISSRLEGKYRGNITGASSNMGTASPSAIPSLQSFAVLNAKLGVNYLALIEGLRLALEAGIPVYQDLAGPQMKQGMELTAGIQYAIY